MKFLPVAFMLSLTLVSSLQAATRNNDIYSWGAVKHAKRVHNVTIVAHRGYSAIAPENTMASFRKAIQIGADMMECDVYRSSDGHLVVMHDGDVARTTNGKGLIWEKSLADLKKLDDGAWFHSDFAGERIPTLDEVLDLAKGRIKMVVEIKQAGIEKEVLAAIYKRNMSKDIVIGSFMAEVGPRLHELNSKVPFMLFDGTGTKLTAQESVRFVDKVKSANGSILGINHTSISPELVKALHDANIRLNAWTVDGPNDIRTLSAMGVDIITTNQPSMALDVITAD